MIIPVHKKIETNFEEESDSKLTLKPEQNLNRTSESSAVSVSFTSYRSSVSMGTAGTEAREQDKVRSAARAHVGPVRFKPGRTRSTVSLKKFGRRYPLAAVSL